MTTYILKKNCPNIGKEIGDYYNGEYGSSEQAIASLLEKGVIEEELGEDFDEELAISAAEDLGLTPDEAERAVEDYRDL